ncbi:3-hydroxybutyryl-CoA dehydrogenase [Desulfallas thermosapovorans]|uniref:3-hydroxybutyryl-CoA dehydrogenase n=1 Tax=Desulfallas thermosapovorans DSM 6562 TaxID=1121431 RepID=A0A5S4ZZ18_9FIRM|nr:3-hydroxybutyryl-CoA dehydrogenase [Desulfallas thermosapovorans]TYO97979.1 3-hydroxybutyryl-CoA dehydrogenase [Desulfallas thermosapovorans DSM 6562]
MTINVIGVVGAGTMGNGIAQVAAKAGYRVIMRDITGELVNRGMAVIEKNLAREVKKQKLTEADAAAALERIKGTTSLADLAVCDFIIEAIIEKMELKKELYRELDQICKPEAYFASNTSGLSVTEMAAVTRRPNKFIGMHFFNPVPVMKLVELIRAAETDDDTVQVTRELVEKMDKESIMVNEAPLFAVNRILVPMLNEAMFVLMEGVASAEDIDKGMKLGANHPIGPLALSDLIGLDTLLMVCDTLYTETGDSKYRPCPLLRKLVRAGHLGRKTGRGFYNYN